MSLVFELQTEKKIIEKNHRCFSLFFKVSNDIMIEAADLKLEAFFKAVVKKVNFCCNSLLIMQASIVVYYSMASIRFILVYIVSTLALLPFSKKMIK